MVITDNRNNNLIHFYHIAVGECFQHNTTIYLRVSSATDVKSGDCFNAVSLNNGAETYFLDLEPVSRIFALIVIDEPITNEKGSYRDNY